MFFRFFSSLGEFQNTRARIEQAPIQLGTFCLWLGGSCILDQLFDLRNMQAVWLRPQRYGTACTCHPAQTNRYRELRGIRDGVQTLLFGHRTLTAASVSYGYGLNTSPSTEEILQGIPEDEPFTFFSPTQEAIDKLKEQLTVRMNANIKSYSDLPLSKKQTQHSVASVARFPANFPMYAEWGMGLKPQEVVGEAEAPNLLSALTPEPLPVCRYSAPPPGAQQKDDVKERTAAWYSREELERTRPVAGTLQESHEGGRRESLQGKRPVVPDQTYDLPSVVRIDSPSIGLGTPLALVYGQFWSHILSRWLASASTCTHYTVTATYA
eukprot:368934-Prorocentrum_minimum.AAC.4